MSILPLPKRAASGAIARAPATAPTPWAVVSRPVAEAIPRAPVWVRCRAITGTRAMKGDAKSATTCDRAYRGTTARLAARRPSAVSKRHEQPDLLGASGRRGKADEEESHDDGEEGRRVGDEGDRVAEGGDRDPCERWADNAPEIELRRVERNCGEEL